MGWDVYAFDASTVGKDKALDLAEQEGVGISYEVGQTEDFKANPGEDDAIALNYCHMQSDIRNLFFDRLVESLAPGGILFLEAFRKEQLGLKSGGPSDPEMLYSAEQLTAEFSQLSQVYITL